MYGSQHAKMAVIECCGMAKRNLSFCAMILVIIGGILVVLSTVVMWGVTDALREDLVRRSIIDSEDDSAFAAWTNGSLATPEYQHSTFYNLTNAEEVMKGGRPHFEEVGPYTYFLVLSKTNVSFSEDKKTAQYTLNTDYLFVPEMSNGTEADIIIGLNVGENCLIELFRSNIRIRKGMRSRYLEHCLFTTVGWKPLFLFYQQREGSVSCSVGTR